LGTADRALQEAVTQSSSDKANLIDDPDLLLPWGQSWFYGRDEAGPDDYFPTQPFNETGWHIDVSADLPPGWPSGLGLAPFVAAYVPRPGYVEGSIRNFGVSSGGLWLTPTDVEVVVSREVTGLTVGKRYRF